MEIEVEQKKVWVEASIRRRRRRRLRPLSDRPWPKLVFA